MYRFVLVEYIATDQSMHTLLMYLFCILFSGFTVGFEFPKYFVQEANILQEVCLVTRGGCQLTSNEVIPVSTLDIGGPGGAIGED